MNLSQSDDMRIIVCGGRDYENQELVTETLAEFEGQSVTIVHGGANGADKLAMNAARELDFRYEVHPANWTMHGRGAGPRRNEEMAELGADVCIAFPGGRGTADMIRRARKHDIPVVEIDQ